MGGDTGRPFATQAPPGMESAFWVQERWSEGLCTLPGSVVAPAIMIYNIKVLDSHRGMLVLLKIVYTLHIIYTLQGL